MITALVIVSTLCGLLLFALVAVFRTAVDVRVKQKLQEERISEVIAKDADWLAQTWDRADVDDPAGKDLGLTKCAAKAEALRDFAERIRRSDMFNDPFIPHKKP